jgi:hypothetical protein
MKAKLLSLIACMAVLGASQAGAATLVGTTSDATGVDGLVVDGTTYDVTFVNGSYNNVYSSTPPTFLGEASTAVDAANALAAALTANAVTEVSGLSTLPPDVFVVIPVFNNGGNFSFTLAEEITSGAWTPSNSVGSGSLSDTQANDDGDLTIFVATTPIPTTLALFAGGLGLIGLIAIRRKRKQPSTLVAA